MADTHPVQTADSRGGRISTDVSLRAYEVYCEVYRPQRALVEGNCRGGFSTGELIVLLYARSFPKAEWKKRCDEACAGAVNIR